MTTNLYDFFMTNGIRFQKTGSSYICNPPVETTDVDYVCLTLKEEDFFNTHKFYRDYDNDSYEEVPSFVSYRKDRINLIVTKDPVFFTRFVRATEIAKEKNLIKKSDRIALFQKVLYPNEEEEILF